MFQDSHTDENDTLISIDAKQDCLDFQEKLMPNGVLYTYKRAFDTCDEDDYVIEVSHNFLGQILGTKFWD